MAIQVCGLDSLVLLVALHDILSPKVAVEIVKDAIIDFIHLNGNLLTSQ